MLCKFAHLDSGDPADRPRPRDLGSARSVTAAVPTIELGLTAGPGEHGPEIQGLFQALDKIKAHVSAQGKACSIEWVIQDSWNREVQVDKETAFVQAGGEMMGCFVGPFVSLTL